MGTRIYELDGLRAIAIALVIGSHYRAFAANFGHVTQFGWMGVDIFFVLSGYLITSILLRVKTAARPYRTFYARRIRRIFPPYYLVLVAVFGAAVLSGVPPVHSALYYVYFLPSLIGTSDMVHHAVAVLTGRVAVPSLLGTPALPMSLVGYVAFSIGDCLGHLWSLSVEEWFYVIWAPLVLTTSRTLTGIAIGAIAATAFLLRWLGFHDYSWYFRFACRLDTLAVGAALALWYSRRGEVSERMRRSGDAIVSAAAVAAALLLVALLAWIRPVLGREIRWSPLFAAFGTPLIGVATAGVIAWILRHQSSPHPLCRVLRSRPMVFVGTVSYTVYLVHVPLYYFAQWLVPGSDWLNSGLAIVLSLTVAAASWKYVESPLLSRG
jgi:peptidoglycan/LPS O-acetylase OafA/YrhL